MLLEGTVTEESRERSYEREGRELGIVAVVETKATGEVAFDSLPAAFHEPEVFELVNEAFRTVTAARASGITLERDGLRLRIEPLGGNRVVRFVVVLRRSAVPGVPCARLTPSERKVCELAAAGLTKVAIAGRLGLSPHTVKTHLRNAYQRLGVGNRVELTRVLSATRDVPAMPVAQVG